MGSVVDLSRSTVIACGLAASISGWVPGSIVGVVAVCALLFVFDV